MRLKRGDLRVAPSDAARLVRCTWPTAARYFRKFGWDGKRGAQPCCKHPHGWYDVPVYDGPDWIGVRIR